MNYKKVFKRETKVIAYVVIALTLVVIGTSYALFLQVNNNQDNQVVTAGSLVIEYAKGNTVTVDENAENNCLKPQSDATGSDEGGCNFTLSVTNKGTLPMQYDLLIYDDVNNEDLPSDAHFVDHSLVRHSLNKQYSKEGASSEIVTAGKALSELDTKEDKRVLESSRIGVGETITFYLNIWISDEATVDIIGQYVYLKLDVVGSVSEQQNFNDYIINQTSIEKIEHEATAQTTSLTDYRYVGANPNNYVYFGCEGDACTENNLYRIIGVIPTQSTVGGEYENRVKLIKADYYTENESGYLSPNWTGIQPSSVPGGYGYYWNPSTNSNRWEENTLNTEVLNKAYWNSLSDYQKYIASSVWYLGGLNYNLRSTYTLENIYSNERGSTKGSSGGNLNTIANIGLMYISDLGYALGAEYQNEVLVSQQSLVWLIHSYNNASENCITPESSGNSGEPYIGACKLNFTSGSQYYTFDFVYPDYKSHHRLSIIRPTFYLKSNVLYASGNGTQEEPYRIERI